MIELVVVLALCVCSLGVAALLGRRLATRRASAYEMQRLLAAVARAGADFQRKERHLLAVSFVVVALALSIPLLVYGDVTASSTDVVWTVFGLALGAGAACLVSYAAFGLALDATARAVEAAQHREQASAATFQGSVLVALATDAASALLTLLVVALPVLLLGDGDAAWFPAALRLLPAAALGATLGAAVFQLGGMSFHAAADIAALVAERRAPSLRATRDGNPALVAELVGSYAGAVAARSLDHFAALVLANATMLLLALAAWVHDPGASAWALLALPLVLRALGLFGSALPLASLRLGLGSEGPGLRLVAAASISAAIVTLVGFVGACRWLLGDGVYLRYAGAALLGLLASASSLLPAASRSWRARSRRAEGLAPAVVGSRRQLTRVLGGGLLEAGWIVAVVALCAALAWRLGAGSARGDGALALASMLAGLLATSAFGLSESMFQRIATGVATLARLRRSALDAAERERAEKLGRQGAELGALGGSRGIVASLGAAALGAFGLPLVMRIVGDAADAHFELQHSAALWGGAFGMGCLLFYVGGAFTTSTRAAKAVSAEVEDRVRDAQAELRSGALDARGLRAPSYRTTVQLASRSALEHLLPLALGALLAPLTLAILLRTLYGSTGHVVVAQGLAAFTAVAALVGSYAALAAEKVASLLASTDRRGTDEVPPELTGPAMELVGRSVAPAALLGMKAAAVAALASGPLLFGN